jgi:hypothetical protein
MFSYLLKSGKPQRERHMNNEKFVDESSEPTCSLKIVPPKCTPMCQLCDVYFYRQVKNYIAKFKNGSVLIAASHKLSTREDCVKMLAFVNHQL